jgi:Xaa-Pro dipeptidase
METIMEVVEKLRRVRAYLAENGMDAMALTLQSNFAWLTGGGENRVYSATELGTATLLVTPDRHCLLANNIETPRLAAEEIAGKGFEIVSYPWYETDGLRKAMESIVGTGRIVADTALPGAEKRDGDIARLRYSLTPQEVERYRWLAMGTAFAVQDACQSVEPGMTEHMIAADVGGALLANGIQPALLLVATDERIPRYRHPLPTDQKLVRCAMVVAGGRKGGLIACLTRLVHFGPPSPDLARRHEAVCRVDATLIAATRPGAAVRDIFRQAVAAYAENGFPDEWQHHHQGGATGYASREYRASPDSEEIVQKNQAFAWNPTIAGTKSEDTILPAESGPEILSAAPDWPMRVVSTPAGDIARPDILVR